MTVNKAEQSLEDQLKNRIYALEQQTRELKTAPQPIGSDILKTTTYVGQIGPITIPATSYNTFTFNYQLSSQKPTLWSFRHTVWIDVFDGSHTWPAGNSLTATQVFYTAVDGWTDSIDSNDSVGLAVYRVYIKNNDTVSHNYWVKSSGLVPAGALL